VGVGGFTFYGLNEPWNWRDLEEIRDTHEGRAASLPVLPKSANTGRLAARPTAPSDPRRFESRSSLRHEVPTWDCAFPTRFLPLCCRICRQIPPRPHSYIR
jgi:hypothetical protein